MVLTFCFNGNNTFTAAFATSEARLLSSLTIIVYSVLRSTNVNKTLFFPFPIIVSPSQSPIRSFLSTISGRSSILTRFLIFYHNVYDRVFWQFADVAINHPPLFYLYKSVYKLSHDAKISLYVALNNQPPVQDLSLSKLTVLSIFYFRRYFHGFLSKMTTSQYLQMSLFRAVCLDFLISLQFSADAMKRCEKPAIVHFPVAGKVPTIATDRLSEKFRIRQVLKIVKTMVNPLLYRLEPDIKKWLLLTI
uniref:Uncharacterized protein n=1 Tax=Heterorhabditis bacteriophora TaxID=37862 RepID=A0A1I7WDA0_HETBA